MVEEPRWQEFDAAVQIGFAYSLHLSQSVSFNITAALK